MVNVRRYAVVGLFVVIGLGGCSTVKQGEIGEGVVKAATTPLSDLNLVKVEIPGVLLRAKEGVYLVPQWELEGVWWDRGLGGVGCAAVRGEVEELDAVLGADVDVLGVQTRRSIGEKVGDEVQGSVMGTLQGVAEGVVPFRGWVRKLSGAQRYSKKVDAAIKAGGLRRAFLKGVLVGGCR